ncbi:MAG TPA: hypothetical protein VJ824_05470 [Bacillota bacterium]|nr:hypothetical protein [Bacillota bacterium]
MEYKLMEPPFPIKSFKEMNKKEAQLHFDWFIEQIPRRMKQLKDVFTLSGENADELDFSVDSLVKLWTWFIPKVIMALKTEQELMAEHQSTPDWLRNAIKPEKISNKSLSIAMDIGIYFAECIRKSHAQIQWGLRTSPKSFISVNKPILLGFKNNKDMDSAIILNNQAIKVSQGEKNPTALYDLYKVWEKFI